MRENWVIKSCTFHIDFNETKVTIAPLAQSNKTIELKEGMIDKTGEVWDRAKLMWFYAELLRYPGEYFFEQEMDNETFMPIGWRVYKERDEMSLINVKRTLLSAEGTLENILD